MVDVMDVRVVAVIAAEAIVVVEVVDVSNAHPDHRGSVKRLAEGTLHPRRL